MLTLAAGDTLAGVATTANQVTYTIFGDDVASGTDTYQVLAQGFLPSVAAAIWSVPGSTSSLISNLTLSNTGGTAQTVVIYRGGTGLGNELTSFIIPANGSATFNGERLEVHDSAGNLLQAFGLSVATPQPIVLPNQGTPGSTGLGSDAGHAHPSYTQSVHMTTTQVVSGTAAGGIGMAVSLPLPNTSYNFEAVVFANVSATSSTAFGVAVAVPAGATLTAVASGPTNSTAIRNAYFTVPGTTQLSFITSTGFTGGITVQGIVNVGTATGTMAIQAGAANTATVQAGWLIAEPIS